jgi:hypothetical protein
MKNFQDILNLTEEQIDLENQKNSTIKNIVETLQLAESYLGRKMTKSEVHLFSDFLIEEEEKQQSAVLKKDNYTVEVSTPDGKVKRKATSQKGILDVIHGERNFRILDSNNRDITAKVKSLIKQRQKEEELKKKYAKRRKMKKGLRTEGVISAVKSAIPSLDDAARGAASAARRRVGGVIPSLPDYDAALRTRMLEIEIGAIDVAPVTPAKVTVASPKVPATAKISPSIEPDVTPFEYPSFPSPYTPGRSFPKPSRSPTTPTEQPVRLPNTPPAKTTSPAEMPISRPSEMPISRPSGMPFIPQESPISTPSIPSINAGTSIFSTGVDNLSDIGSNLGTASLGSIAAISARSGTGDPITQSQAQRQRIGTKTATSTATDDEPSRPQISGDRPSITMFPTYSGEGTLGDKSRTERTTMFGTVPLLKIRSIRNQ